ncbi:MAG: archaeosortase A [Salinirussus sp.]
MATSLQVLGAVSLAWEHRGWIVVLAFIAGSVAEYRDRELARSVLVLAWIALGAFFASMLPYFIFEQKSVVESAGTLLGVPLSLAVGYHLHAGRDSLFVLSRAVAVAGLIYQPAVAIPIIRRTLIEVVTDQTAWLLAVLGYTPEVVAGLTVDGLRIAEKTYPYESTFVFRGNHELPITYTIAMACTGIGSMAVFAALIGSVSAPWPRKARALLVSLPIIYVLNIVRNVFIAVGFGEQRFHIAPELVMTVFGLSDPVMVSYIVADRIIAQGLSVIALVGITWLVVRELPEVLGVVEDALFVLTGREYDLAGALGVSESASPA